MENDLRGVEDPLKFRAKVRVRTGRSLNERPVLIHTLSMPARQVGRSFSIAASTLACVWNMIFI